MLKTSLACLFILLMHAPAYAESSQSKPLDKLDNKQLVAQFEKCLNETGDFDYAEELKAEIIRRKAAKETVALFKKNNNIFAATGWCYEILVELRSPETDKLLKQYANDKLDDRNYFANKYFALTGDKLALEHLNANYFEYGTSSAEWAETVILFGKYKYYPAAKNLISTLDAASLDLGGASCESLKLLYPETRNNVEEIESRKDSIDGMIQDIINYYTKYVKDHPAGDHK